MTDSNNTSLQVFNSEDFGSIRALTIDSAPWLVLARRPRRAKGNDSNGV